MHPEIGQNQPKYVSFWTKHWFYSEVLSILKKTKKNGGWAKRRAIGSRPVIWNPKVYSVISWSPYRNEIKWHPRLNFDNFFNQKHSEPGKFWGLSFPVVIFDPRNMYPPGETNGTLTVCRQRRGDQHPKQTKKNLETLRVGMRALQSCFSFSSNTPCDQEIRVAGRRKKQCRFFRVVVGNGFLGGHRRGGTGIRR